MFFSYCNYSVVFTFLHFMFVIFRWRFARLKISCWILIKYLTFNKALKVSTYNIYIYNVRFKNKTFIRESSCSCLLEYDIFQKYRWCTNVLWNFQIFRIFFLNLINGEVGISKNPLISVMNEKRDMNVDITLRLSLKVSEQTRSEASKNGTRKTPTLKIPTRMIPPDNSHPENPHRG